MNEGCMTFCRTLPESDTSSFYRSNGIVFIIVFFFFSSSLMFVTFKWMDFKIGKGMIFLEDMDVYGAIGNKDIRSRDTPLEKKKNTIRDCR